MSSNGTVSGYDLSSLSGGVVEPALFQGHVARVLRFFEGEPE